MVLSLDGNSETGAQGYSKIDNLICLRQYTKSIAVANLIIFKNPFLHLRNEFCVTIYLACLRPLSGQGTMITIIKDRMVHKENRLKILKTL